MDYIVLFKDIDETHRQCSCCGEIQELVKVWRSGYGDTCWQEDSFPNHSITDCIKHLRKLIEDSKNDKHRT